MRIWKRREYSRKGRDKEKTMKRRKIKGGGAREKKGRRGRASPANSMTANRGICSTCPSILRPHIDTVHSRQSIE